MARTKQALAELAGTRVQGCNVSAALLAADWNDGVILRECAHAPSTTLEMGRFQNSDQALRPGDLREVFDLVFDANLFSAFLVLLAFCAAFRFFAARSHVCA